MSVPSCFTVTTRFCPEGERLHDYLDRFFPFQQDRNWPVRLTELSIDGAAVATDQNPELSNNQVLAFSVRDYHEDPVDTAWSLLWQNDELMAIHKPAPLPMHRTTRHIQNTLTTLVREQTVHSKAQPLHRLDQETAGIVIFAKTPTAAERWQPQFKTLLDSKRYRAIVYGDPSWSEMELTTRLAQQEGSAIRCQMYVVGDDQPGKVSTTEFRVVRRGSGYSELECRLITGRKHQIRAHLAHLGHPIVGDKIYAQGGEFYLKRIADECTDADWQRLLTPHHLLMAFHVDLKLSDTVLQTVVDEHWPPAWRQFYAAHFPSED